MRTTGKTRLDAHWREHLDTLADCVVAAGGVKSAACRRINDRFDLPKTLASGKRLGAFTPGKLQRWLASAEFRDAVQAAKQRVQEAGADAPATRSATFRRFAKETVQRYEAELAATRKELADADDEDRSRLQTKQAALEAQIVDLRKAERTEEKHGQDLARRAVLSDVHVFAKAFARLVVHLGAQDVLKRLARDVRRAGDCPAAARAVYAATRELEARAPAERSAKPVTLHDLHERAARGKATKRS